MAKDDMWPELDHCAWKDCPYCKRAEFRRVRLITSPPNATFTDDFTVVSIEEVADAS